MVCLVILHSLPSNGGVSGGGVCFASGASILLPIFVSDLCELSEF